MLYNNICGCKLTLNSVVCCASNHLGEEWEGGVGGRSGRGREEWEGEGGSKGGGWCHEEQEKGI